MGQPGRTPIVRRRAHRRCIIAQGPPSDANEREKGKNHANSIPHSSHVDSLASCGKVHLSELFQAFLRQKTEKTREHTDRTQVITLRIQGEEICERMRKE